MSAPVQLPGEVTEDGGTLSFRWHNPRAFAEVQWYSGGWGSEWSPRSMALTPGGPPVTFQSTRGRSGGEVMPTFALASEAGLADFAIGVSGNYAVSVSRDSHGTAVTVEIPSDGSDRPFVLAHECQPGPARYLDKHAYVEASLPRPQRWAGVLYNHWWAYEDQWIDEDIFVANAAVAASLGCEMAVLDAGWFGTDPEWFLTRGDWDRVSSRFPSGLAALADKVRQLGLHFGIWCEIEGIGTAAAARDSLKGLLATRGGDDLGYLCLGAKGAPEWAQQHLSSLISQTGATYLKWDFNLDPGAGCDRADHGHDPRFGLAAHNAGVYALADALHRRFPELLVENCSSGGQRLDLAMSRHFDVSFLSDRDETDHHLQCLFGASLWLPPSRLLHFSWSGARPTAGFAPLDYEAAEPSQVKHTLRANWANQWGLSHRLVEYSPLPLDLLRAEISFYRQHVEPVARRGSFHWLRFDREIQAYCLQSPGATVVVILTRGEQDVLLSGASLPQVSADNRAIAWSTEGLRLSFAGSHDSAVLCWDKPLPGGKLELVAG